MLMPRQFIILLTVLAFAAGLAAASPVVAAPDAAFTRFLESLWPEAQGFGVSRKTFTSATHQLEPDLTLPDLDIPGRKTPPPAQAEFVQTPADYVRESTIARLAEQGKKLAADHRTTLAAIEQKFGVPGNVLLAIW